MAIRWALHSSTRRPGLGGPAPAPGPDPGAGPGPAPAPTPQPTPHPTPGPLPVAPPLSGSPLDGLGAAIQRGLDGALGAGQILLGALLVGAGVLIVLAQTGAGGELARSTVKATKAAGKLALTVAK